MTFDNYQAFMEAYELSWVQTLTGFRLRVSTDVWAVVETVGDQGVRLPCPRWYVMDHGFRLEGNPHDTIEACQHAASDRAFRAFTEAAEDSMRRLR